MVLYSDVPPEMYKQLHKLEQAAEGRDRKHKLQSHNFVNNADAVPRFLGGSLNTVHQALESYAPSMSVSRLGHVLFQFCNVMMLLQSQPLLALAFSKANSRACCNFLLLQSAHGFGKSCRNLLRRM